MSNEKLSNEAQNPPLSKGAVSHSPLTDTFRFFIRKNFKDAGGKMSNEDIDELGIEFHKYLDEKLNEEQKQKILPKTPMEVIMNMEHPLKTNGFDPAYMLHFTQWIELMQSQS